MKQWTEELKHNLDSVQTHAYNLEYALRLEAEASKVLLEAVEEVTEALSEVAEPGQGVLLWDESHGTLKGYLLTFPLTR